MALGVVMLGATGAVGSHTARALAIDPRVERITLLGRRSLSDFSAPTVEQHVIDIHAAGSYSKVLPGHDAAICTLGIGQPSKVSKDEFVRVDKLAVLDFATACRDAGISHFEILTSVATSRSSPLFYLRVKGELETELVAMGFGRLSIFQPSMIITPTNRYGLSQAIILRVWPCLTPFLIAGLRKYRGIQVGLLGRAMARNLFENKSGAETLRWDDFQALGVCG